ncbi:MAG: DUF308 domain-containing protein [Bacteroidota bacterium]
MKKYFAEEYLLSQFKVNSIIIGGLLVLTGFTAIVLPEITSLTLSYILGWLLVISGIISAYHVVQSYNAQWIAWLKPFSLAIIGILLLFYPITGVAAVGLLLIIYFLFDGFGGIMLGLEFKPIKGWVWMLANGIISFLLAAICIIGWPFSFVWLVGLMVGISLLFDGIAMIIIGNSIGDYFVGE